MQSEERPEADAEQPDMSRRPYRFDFAHVGPVNKEAAFEGLCEDPSVGFRIAVDMLEEPPTTGEEREATVERLARLAAAERDCHTNEAEKKRANVDGLESHREFERLKETGLFDGVEPPSAQEGVGYAAVRPGAGGTRSRATLPDSPEARQGAGADKRTPAVDAGAKQEPLTFGEPSVARKWQALEVLSLYLSSAYHSILDTRPGCKALLYRHAARALLSDYAEIEARERRAIEQALRVLRETYHRREAIDRCHLYSEEPPAAPDTILAAELIEGCAPPLDELTRADMQRLFSSLHGRWRGQVVVCGQLSKYGSGPCSRRVNCLTKQASLGLSAFVETEISMRPELVKACKPGAHPVICMPVLHEPGMWRRARRPVLRWIHREMRSLRKSKGRHIYLD